MTTPANITRRRIHPIIIEKRYVHESYVHMIEQATNEYQMILPLYVIVDLNICPSPSKLNATISKSFAGVRDPDLFTFESVYV